MRSRLRSEDHRPNRPIVGGLLVTIASAFFSGNVVIGKVALKDGRSIIEILTIRLTVAPLLLLLLLFATRKSLILARPEGVLLPLAGALTVVDQAVFYAALRHATAAAVSVIFFTYPIFVILIWWALGRGRPAMRSWVAVCSASMGTTLLLALGNEIFGNASTIALALASALMYATYIVLVRLAIRDANAIAASLWILGTGGLIMIAFSTLTGQAPFLQVGVRAFQWVPLAAMGITSAIGVLCLIAGLPLIGPVRAAILGATEPLATALIAAGVLQEPLGSGVIVGGTFIIAAVVLSSSQVAPVLRT